MNAMMNTVRLEIFGSTPVLRKLHCHIAPGLNDSLDRYDIRLTDLQQAVAVVLVLLKRSGSLKMFQISTSKPRKSLIHTILNYRRDSMAHGGEIKELCRGEFLKLFRPPQGQKKPRHIEIHSLQAPGITVISQGVEIADKDALYNLASDLAKTRGWDLRDYTFPEPDPAAPNSINLDVLPSVPYSPAGSSGAHAICVRPEPPFQVARHGELLEQGRTADQIWDETDWIDNEIAHAEADPIFGEEHWLDRDTGLRVAERDEWSLLYLVDRQRRVWGYSTMMALHREYFEQALVGQYYEPHVRLEHTLPIIPSDSPLNIFIFAVDTHPLLWRNPYLVRRHSTFPLLRELSRFQVKIEGTQSIRVAQVGAVAVSDSGRELCRLAHMRKVRSFERAGDWRDSFLYTPQLK